LESELASSSTVTSMSFISTSTSTSPLPGGFFREETHQTPAPTQQAHSSTSVPVLAPLSVPAGQDPSRWLNKKMRQGSHYTYDTLAQCKSDLDRLTHRRGPGGAVIEKRNIYGVVEGCTVYSDTPKSYHIRIMDETLQGILVRIHPSATEPNPGPPIFKDDIIRIHRAAVSLIKIYPVRF
jgi:hypothetical protein